MTGVRPFLRQTIADRDALRIALERDLAALAAGVADEHARARLLGRVGEAYRMLGDPDRAAPYLSEALLAARHLGDEPGVAANLIRLATALQHGGEHPRAESLFREALAFSGRPDCATYKDFALQHLGKCLVETGRIDEAIGCFEEALAARLAKGDAALVASTEEALAAARALAGPPPEPGPPA